MIYESEQDELILVSAILSVTNPDVELIDRVDPEALSGWRAKIWEYARELRAEGKAPTPRRILSRAGGDVVMRQALEPLRGQTYPPARVRDAERVVTDLAKFRRLQGALTGALERMAGADSYSEALEAAHGELGRLEQATPPSAVIDFSQLWDEWLEDLNSPPVASKPIPTPWPHLDDKLAGGLHRGRTYVVGGRPGEGKSLAGVNLAVGAAEAGHPAIVFSVEMGRKEVAARVIASGAHADYGQITRRNIDDHHMGRVAEWGDTNRSMPLQVVDRADIGVEYVAAVCRTVKRTRGLDVVFVDYLQLLKPAGSKLPRHEQIGHMSRALKVLAMDLDVAVVIACQLNRNSANEKRPPVLADLRESGSIEQDCDVAILLNHKRADNGDHTGDIELVVAKNRTGSTGTITARWAAYQARIA
ncbi:DnaB-like replicative helicase [Gordonia phage Asapag]|uniref:DnaB-like dsDNA helicase n=1 Tax=Gordonia phage Asapag TaxID=2507862 RepID=A0A410TDX7_9CAUD|nr:DnaB-like replicative helicase [Gordonia phage Asapag]QAU07223.1 DnaB-like dsDNA helicase [Gordonia phage Asapag]